jgi:indole-3-glycerol phosphate synthase
VNILDRILADKLVTVAQCIQEHPVEGLQAAALGTPEPIPFAAALQAAPIGLIAEVKRRSPSAGVIRDPFDPSAIATAYEHAGAQAVSVLMDEPYFGGGEDDFRAVRTAVGLPMLYKEFVVDPWQVWHARLIGASAILLIAAALEDSQLQALSEVAAEAGLEVLLEVHDAEELQRALALEAPLIGINNRNLKTFETRLHHTLDLIPQIPESVCLISESGIRTADDVQQLQEAGCAGVLVGEHLLRKPDLETAVRELMGR